MAYTVDTSGYRRYAQELNRAARRVKLATAIFLSEQALDTRAEAWAEIQNTMIVRSARFLKGRLRTTPASKARPVMAQVARVGSQSKPRFSGWAEQEKGGQVKERVGMTLSRGNTIKGRMKPRFRLKPGKRFPSPSNTTIANAKSPAHRAHAFLRIMSRQRKKPFILFGHRKLPSGLWTLEGRHGKKQWPKPRLLQAFNANEKIRRNRWMSNALRDFRRRFNPRTAWAGAWFKSGVTKRK